MYVCMYACMHACNILNKKLIPEVILFWHKWTNYIHKLIPSGKFQHANTSVAQIFRFLLWKMYEGESIIIRNALAFLFLLAALSFLRALLKVVSFL